MSKLYFLIMMYLTHFFEVVYGMLLAIMPWVALGVTLGLTFILVIFIRISVPRFRVETLSRLGWANLLTLLSLCVGAYFLGLLCG